MKLLFWVNKFPAVSETFIRDNIIQSINNNLEVLIYTSRNKTREFSALQGFEKYQLLKKTVDTKDILPASWRARKLKIYLILFFSLFNGNYKYYKKALTIKRHKLFPKAFEFFFLVNFILKHKINVIHAHYGNNGQQAVQLKKIGLPIKVVTTFHGYDIRLGIKKPLNFYSELFEKADKIIAISDYSKENLIKFGLNEEKLSNIPNGVDTDYFKPLNCPHKAIKTTFLSVGRLVDEKAFNTAIMAMAKFKEQHPKRDIEYKIIGDGENFSQLKKIIKKFKAQAYIHLLGSKNRHEVLQEMQLANVFLLSSINEVLPTVLLEAQACELPILATKVGNIYKMVNKAVLVEPNNVDELARGIEEMINLKNQWSEIGKVGRNNVIKHYNIKRTSKQLLALYHE